MARDRKVVHVTKEVEMDNSGINAVDILLVCVFLALVTVFSIHVAMI